MEQKTPSHSEILNHSLLLIWDLIWNLKLSGDTGTHDADFQSNYANLTAGFSFNLYQVGLNTIWIWVSVWNRELKVTRTDSNGGKTEYTTTLHK